LNTINPKKLLHSKWTAVRPSNKEKHFIVAEVEFNEEGDVVYCLLEAVLTNRAEPIDWTELREENSWLQGWK